jgi:SOS-response transcriptional repressor LexA
VITSPEEKAVQGHACVARQEGQIGVNCKIFQRTDTDVLLIPVNEAYSPQTVPIDKLLWAYRVLYRVRLSSEP